MILYYTVTYISWRLHKKREILRISDESNNGILQSRKKEGASTLRDSVDGTGEHCAK